MLGRREPGQPAELAKLLRERTYHAVLCALTAKITERTADVSAVSPLFETNS